MFHGICSGWIAYLSLIYEYAKNPNRAILLVDYPYITMKMRFDVLPPEIFIERVCGILEKHHIARTAVVGHSYGTVIATWLVHARPDVVAQVCGLVYTTTFYSIVVFRSSSTDDLGSPCCCVCVFGIIS